MADRRKPVTNRTRLLFATLTWVAWLLGELSAAENVRAPAIRGGAIVLKNEACRYEIGTDGKNRTLVSLADAKDYGEANQPFMLAGRGQNSRSGDTRSIVPTSFAHSGSGRAEDPLPALSQARR